MNNDEYEFLRLELTKSLENPNNPMDIDTVREILAEARLKLTEGVV